MRILIWSHLHERVLQKKVNLKRIRVCRVSVSRTAIFGQGSAWYGILGLCCEHLLQCTFIIIIIVFEINTYLHMLLFSFRVLKPPGGGSSDIFGASNSAISNTPRSVSKNHVVSNIFGAPQNRSGK